MPVSNIWSSVDWLAEHVQHAPERRGPHRHRDRRPGVGGFHPAAHAVGRLHRDRAHAVLAEVLLDLAHHVEDVAAGTACGHSDGVVNRRKVSALELDVDDRSDDLDDFAGFLAGWHLCSWFDCCRHNGVDVSDC
jgi:hypothetical protein